MEETLITRTYVEDLIREYMGLSGPLPNMIKRQINSLVLDDNFTLKEVARCAVWYVEVAQKEISPLYGVKIFASIREEVDKYFKKLELDQRNQAIEAKKIVEYQDNNIIFNIKSLEHKKRQPKQLDMNEIHVEGEDKYDN